MMKKFYIILIISFLFLISLNFVSANNDVVYSNATDYSSLQLDINNHDIIKLNNNIIYNDSDVHYKNGMVINKSITIDGQSHIIDGNNQSRIFYINSTNVVLTLINITLTNTNTKLGGAILVNASNNGNFAYCGKYSDIIINNNENYNFILKGHDVIFVNNHATVAGGVIFSDHNIIINGTNFNFINNSIINNTISCTGGVIYSNKNIFIDGKNITFENNHAYWGGVCFSLNDIIINGTNINFINNSGVYGGVINVNNTLIIYGEVLFKNNFNLAVNGLSGAIFSNNLVLIKGSTNFIKNTANNGFGGAIFSNNVIIEGFANFNGNSANSGGAIYANNVFLNNTVSFISNRANFGACILIASGNLKIVKAFVDFSNNIANSQGGAIYIEQGTVNITGFATFINNYAMQLGGAIFSKNGNVFIYYSVFNNNMDFSVGSTILLLNPYVSCNFNYNYWGGNFYNEMYSKQFIFINYLGYVSPKWWVLLDIEAPEKVKINKNNSFKLIFNKITNGTNTNNFNHEMGKFTVSLVSSGGIVSKNGVANGIVNFTSDEINEYSIIVKNGLTGSIIKKINFKTEYQSFVDLQELIDKNDVIILNQSYIFDYRFDHVIIINKPVIIGGDKCNGEGYYIDGKGIATFFNIQSNGSLTLSNINLINSGRIAIRNDGVLNLSNVYSNGFIFNSGRIISSVIFTVLNKNVSTYDSYIFLLKTKEGIPIYMDNLIFKDDLGHSFSSFIFNNKFYMGYVPPEISGFITFNHVTLKGLDNLTSSGSLFIKENILKNVNKKNSNFINNFKFNIVNLINKFVKKK